MRYRLRQELFQRDAITPRQQRALRFEGLHNGRCTRMRPALSTKSTLWLRLRQ